ncbi:hypothetical protein QLH52_01230 [Methylomonas sp. OY6]|uniref:Uncharacterized protein n=1 Tax=Methylomonas defluvii TaxID=3045149 RepID=A0ABU4UA61_9GAMM|nr:hypothetical protein [Methylomonas sp. OY6]
MTSGWDGHYCEENFREVVFEIAIIIAISLIGQKKFEICVGLEVYTPTKPPLFFCDIQKNEKLVRKRLVLAPKLTLLPPYSFSVNA